MSLYNSVEQFETDAALAHQIIHGDENTTVLTEGGPVDSFAKLLKYLRDTVTNELTWPRSSSRSRPCRSSP
ncbi:hypothetical protein ULF88_03190 [Halopseudomonas pachastrellae]|nr:hypothetical protein [Halopseudomonas pachastrellae]